MLKLYCTICEKLIGEITKDQTGNITGEELCRTCEHRVAFAFKEVQNAREKALKEMADCFAEVKRATEELQALEKGKRAQVDIILAHSRDLIKEEVRKVLEEKKNSKKKQLDSGE